METKSQQERLCKGNRILAALVPFAVAVIIGRFVFYFGERWFAGHSSLYAWIALGCQLLLYAVSTAAFLAYKHRAKNVRLAELRDRLLKKKAQADQGDARASAALMLCTVGFFLWMTVCFALPIVTLLFAGANEQNLWVCIPGTIVSVFTLSGVLAALFSFGLKPPSETIPDILPRERFPLLYQTLDEVFADEPQKPVLCLYQLDNVAVTRQDGKVVVGLGSYTGAFLNREELRQILLHEKAHIVQGEKTYVRLANGIIKRFREPSQKCIVWKPVDIVLYTLLAPMSNRLSDYLFTSAERQERAADAYAIRNGKASESAAALVKIRILSLFLSREAKANPLFYETEEVQTDFYQRGFADFRKACPKRLAFWQSLLTRELPQLIGSHPTLPQRLQALGNPAYSIAFDDPDPAYCAEQGELLRLEDENTEQCNAEGYAERRKYQYLEPKALIEQTQAEEQNGVIHTALQLRPVIEACMILLNEELALHYCEKALSASENESEAAYANYVKGRILLDRYDPNGIELIRRAAAANDNYLENAGEQITSFCRLMGLEEALRENRKYLLELAQKKVDDRVSDADDLNPNDTLSGVPVLSEQALREELTFIQTVCGEHLQELYRVTKRLSASLSATVYIVRFEKDTKEDVRDRCMQRIFEYLDGRDAQYSLFDYEYAEQRKVRLNKIKGALIYRKSK